MSSHGTPKDPDDFFAETRMSFGDHLEELRTHLWRAITGLGIGMFLSLFIGHYVVAFITAPIKHELRNYRDRRKVKVEKDIREKMRVDPGAQRATPFTTILVPRDQFVAAARGERLDMPRPRVTTKEEVERRAAPRSPLGRFAEGIRGLVGGEKKEDAEEEEEKHTDIIADSGKNELIPLWVSIQRPYEFEGPLQEAQRELLELDNPSTWNIQEGFMVWLKVCMMCGVVLGSPWIFWQVWSFVAAGLYPQEKRLVNVYLPISLGLFLAGVLLCEVFVIPKAISALLWFNEWMDLKPEIRLNEWLPFAIWMPVIFGMSFQTPLVMLFLAKIGVADENTFRTKRKFALFIMAIFAAVITPSPDALSMLFLWVPMILLFELGIILIRWTTRPAALDVDVPEPDEMVEV